MQIKTRKSAAHAKAFLKALHKSCLIKINKVLIDNGKEFTDRLFTPEREPSGHHEFDRLCRELSIKHRLTRPGAPQANGMVESFNGRISDVLKTHRFTSGEDMRQTLLRYVHLYSHQLPQSALNSRTPMQELRRWYDEKPALFLRKPKEINRPGCDISSLSLN